ncbi:anhydro-N-acetylmuramic acid kinase [Colwellia psychrerythraea]|uniref:Anhydro-N-acetylmuramic acid kinase n=1 Tax=Colwellia psychrerythraea TaxID=28229 RepID=A0A099L461_COLPS|nr:anhydro-N-acetylmuramic acid kinase [Colwellia psychrerythraea]KGJ96633.1 Anhydro-N-acetylmuramic acid kinase [Colwellia psychrerythraea]
MTDKESKVQGKYYIGLMSGTSADGIDLALVDFSDSQQKSRLIASFYQDYNCTTAKKITSLYQQGTNEIDRAFHLDVELAHLFSQAIIALLKQENLSASDIIAIGNHGQTIRHRPSDDNPFTLQIGCCQTLATLTNIRVVGQFRRKDMALGGQGAPLVPIFHQQLFADSMNANFVVNIGGIANITFLPEQGSDKTVLGFDTGPGNALLDDWFLKHHQASHDKFDKSGLWAATGNINQALLMQLMQDAYIKAVAPKSTGREYFNLDWLEQQLTTFYEKSNLFLSAEDIQATLLAFTAQSISAEVMSLAKQGKVYLCGGGVHNNALVAALKHSLNNSESAYTVDSMQALNVDGDILEAMAFAWLAYAFDQGLVSNMPAVTGASATCTLGNEFLP